MPTVNIGGWVYPSFNSTEGIAVDIFLSGCAREPKCEGCYNPYMWDFNYGEEWQIFDIKLALLHTYKDADSIAIMGGEPLNQKDIEYLLAEIKLLFPSKPLWVYTSYELHEIPEELLIHMDFIKTGRFDKNQLSKGRLASRNQMIWKKEYNRDGETEFCQYLRIK